MGAPLSDGQRKSLGLCFLLCAIAVAFLNSFHVSFLFDDGDAVLNNGTLANFFSFDWLVPPSDGPTAGRPFANGTFALNLALGGTDVFGFHVFDFLLHAGSSALLFFLLIEVFGSVPREDMRKRRVELAFVCALLWAVHPLNSQTVIYIAQRTEGLMGFFYLAVVYCYWQYQKNTDVRTWALLCVMACFLGLGCREELATAPILVLLIDRTFHSESFKQALVKRRFLYAALFSCWIALAFLWRSTEQHGVGFTYHVRSTQYLLTEGRVVAQYIKLVFFPHPLVFDYELSPYRKYLEEAPYALAAVLAVVVMFLLLARRALAGLAMAWFFFILGPTSSLIPVATQPMGENRVYLPSIAIILIAVCVVFLLLRRWSWILFAGLSCCAIYGTQVRNEDFSSPVGIWSDTITKVPQSLRARYNLGFAYADEQRFAEADQAFDGALQLRSDSYLAWYGKAKVAMERHDLNAAEKYFLKALQFNSNAPTILGAVAFFYAQKKEYTRASDYAHRVLETHPRSALAWGTLAEVAFAKGNYTEAVQEYFYATAFAPTNAFFHNNLGGCLVRLGDIKAAQKEFLTAIKLRANFAKAKSNLAFTLAQSGRLDEAAPYFVAALANDPTDGEARINLGLLYLKTGKNQSAEICFREALRRDPHDARARELLASLH